MGNIKALAAVAVAASLTLVAASACSPPSDVVAQSNAGGAVYTSEEVKKATGAREVKPLFAVPKRVGNLRLAFLNPGKTYPFFASWSQGMQDAARFYGVTVDEADLDFKYENALSAYEGLSVKQPVVVGSGGSAMNAAAVAAAKANQSKVVVVDGPIQGATDFGVSDEIVGKLAISTIADAVRKKQAGIWAGKEILVAGISAASCPPCDARIAGSFAEAESALGISKNATFRLEPPTGSDPTSAAANTFTDFLTAHPHAAVVVVSYGDAPVVGAVNATRAANRSTDVMAIASGGDATSRAALRDPANTGLLLASIDYQPYSEGWNWVEAAIATHLGKGFDPYQVSRVLTPENVNQFYPDDK